MATTPEPNFHGRQLTRALRVLREQAGITQHHAGQRLHMTLQKLSRMENGQLPGYFELQAMLELYGLPVEDRDHYLSLWDRARERGWWRKYGLKDVRYVCMEDVAPEVYEFQIGYVPELLQTEHYARMTLTDDTEDTSGKTITSIIKVRMTRQQRLLGDPPLRLHSIVHEPVLHQGVDNEQLTHLIRQAKLPNITFQVLPQDRGLHQGLRGSLTLLSFPNSDEPDIVFAESAFGRSDTQDSGRTSAARCTLDRLAKMALSPTESLKLLARLKRSAKASGAR